MINYFKIKKPKWTIQSYSVKSEPKSDEWWEREMKNVVRFDMDKFKVIIGELNK